MILRQFLHQDPIGISYLFGCGGQAKAAVCDPVDDPQLYLNAAKDLGVEIKYVIDTHLHADHVSGGRKLAEQGRAEYVLHHSADTQFVFKGVQDGDVLQLGNVAVQILHTPGHTPEHISLQVTDRTRTTEPWFLLTGHAIMVGDVGRTELANQAEVGAESLFHTIQRVKTLPDYLEILPGAYAGSVCGRSLSGKPISTVGFERRFNRAFAFEDIAPFTRFMLDSIPPAPPNAVAIRLFNQGVPAVA